MLGLRSAVYMAVLAVALTGAAIPAHAQTGEKLYSQAENALSGGKAAEAVDLYSKAIRSGQLGKDRLAKAFVQRGRAQQLSGQHARAVADFTNALWLDALDSGSKANALGWRAASRKALGQIDLAKKDDADALKVDPSFSPAPLPAAPAAAPASPSTATRVAAAPTTTTPAATRPATPPRERSSSGGLLDGLFSSSSSSGSSQPQQRAQPVARVMDADEARMRRITRAPSTGTRSATRAPAPAAPAAPAAQSDDGPGFFDRLFGRDDRPSTNGGPVVQAQPSTPVAVQPLGAASPQNLLASPQSAPVQQTALQAAAPTSAGQGPPPPRAKPRSTIGAVAEVSRPAVPPRVDERPGLLGRLFGRRNSVNTPPRPTRPAAAPTQIAAAAPAQASAPAPVARGEQPSVDPNSRVATVSPWRLADNPAERSREVVSAPRRTPSLISSLTQPAARPAAAPAPRPSATRTQGAGESGVLRANRPGAVVPATPAPTAAPTRRAAPAAAPRPAARQAAAPPRPAARPAQEVQVARLDWGDATTVARSQPQGGSARAAPAQPATEPSSWFSPSPAVVQPRTQPRSRQNIGSINNVPATSATAPRAARPAAAPQPQARRVARAAPAAAPRAPRRTTAAAPAPRVRSSDGAYAVQVAARRTLQEAQREASSLASRHGGVLAGQKPYIVKVDIPNKGTFYRVRVGPYRGGQQVASVCQQLKGRGQDCFTVKP